jgi:hypothetical protein
LKIFTTIVYDENDMSSCFALSTVLSGAAAAPWYSDAEGYVDWDILALGDLR